MRQPQNPKRGRGRGRRGNGGVSHNHVPNRNTSYESNGPDVKLRGNAQQLNEKYMALAHDAATSGERIMAEAYTQFADHYFRLHQAAVGVAETKRLQDQAEAVNNAEAQAESGQSKQSNGEDTSGAAADAAETDAAETDTTTADSAGTNSADTPQNDADAAQSAPPKRRRNPAGRHHASKASSSASNSDAADDAAGDTAGDKKASSPAASLSPAQLAEAVQDEQDSKKLS